MITCKYCDKFQKDCPSKRKNGNSKACIKLKRKLLLTEKELFEFLLSQEKIKSYNAELKLATYIYNQMLQSNPEIATIIKNYNKKSNSWNVFQDTYNFWKKKIGKRLGLKTIDKCLIDEHTGTVTIDESIVK